MLQGISQSNITDNSSLNTRLDLNHRYGKFDFDSWVAENYHFSEGMDVLDVGCGNGAQALQALAAVGSRGSVSAIDISKESVDQMMAMARSPSNLEGVVADMRDLALVIRDRFKVRRYDVAHSTYALWYAGEHVRVLEAMRSALKPNGRLIVTTPGHPNGLRELVKRLGKPTPLLDPVTSFGPNVLAPYFQSSFVDVKIHLRRNYIDIPSAEEVLRFFRATAYYFQDIESRLMRQVQLEIDERGFFRFEKNNYMIIGEQPVDGF